MDDIGDRTNMKYATKEEINFSIQILKMAKDKIPKDSYSYTKVERAVNHTILELDDLQNDL